MKSFNNIRKAIGATLIGALATLLPQSAMAGNALVNGTGVSDETLFLILAVIAIFQLVAILVIAGVIKSIVQNKEVWQMRWGKGAAGVATLFLLFTASSAHAAEDADFDALVNMGDTGFIALVTLNLFLFFAFLYLVSKLNGLFKMLMQDEEGKVPETFMDKVNAMLTDAVPVEKEEDVLMDHEYDGIHELDNNLPPWWLYGFYFSIVFGVVYVINYHFTDNGKLQIEEYVAEMEAAEEAKAAFVATQENTVDESNVELLTDASDLAAGGKTFKLYCAPCHGENGGSMPGGVGPNLTDDYWIHGGSVTDIFKTIKYGVPEKGMVSWQAQLNPTQIQQVSSYIKSLKGTNPENAKEPQGDLWEETATSEPTEESTEPTTDEETPAEEATDAEQQEEVTMVE
jgi:cytochrome c oxidase cbb3-type subunit 3